MAYTMDMASGTVLSVEEPSFQLKRDTRVASRDTIQTAEYPQLQLAMVETQAQTEVPAFPATVVEALIKTLED